MMMQAEAPGLNGVAVERRRSVSKFVVEKLLRLLNVFGVSASGVSKLVKIT